MAELIISGGGEVAVATDELHAARERLGRLAHECAEIAALLERVDAITTTRAVRTIDAPVAALYAESAIRRARVRLAVTEVDARALGAALGLAIDGYGLTQSIVSRFVQDAAGTIASILGFALGRAPWLALLAAPVVPGLLAGFAALAVRHGGAGGAVNAVISDPATVALVRLAVSSADEGMLGLMGAPPPVADALGDPGLGAVALGTVAGGLVTAGGLAGLTRETPVQLVAQKTTSVAPPAGWDDRLGRVPRAADDGGTQVVIERYSTPGEPDRFGVFVGGTVDFGVGETGEPWDMTSNLGNASGVDAGSVRAVVEAMQLAGIGPGDPVQLTGYSQGGAVAAIIAASGDYDVAGLVTFGGNTGHVRIPETIPTVIVEHSDDIVPATGGVQRNTHAVLVERQALAGADLPQGVPAPAHQLTAYRATAELMDAADSGKLTGAAAALDAFTAGAAVERTEYHFVRVHDAPGGSGGV